MQLIRFEVFIISLLMAVIIGCIIGMAIYLIIDRKKSEEKTNYNRIKNMSVEEMAEFIAEKFVCGCYFGGCSNCLSDDEYDIVAIKKILESEVEGE